MRRITLLLAVASVTLGLSACETKPRESYVQWVARDAWNPQCADQAMVEVWKASNPEWKEKGKSVTVDVDATFKLGNDCEVKGAKLEAYKSFQFKQSIEMVKCTAAGKDGWALAATPDRCWTGPKLTASE
jgi:hypothetical protein